jgi:threonine aldolase
MRRAMAEAEVGDDVLDGDPTVRRLEARAAELLGKERSLFLPTGVMGNQIALWVQGERGTEILTDALSHIIDWEICASAAISGLQIRPVTGKGVMMDVEALERAYRSPVSEWTPRASLVCLENTHNGAGGAIISLGGMRAMSDAARRFNCRVHLDGARLWNAAVATGTSVANFAACADTVLVSFSKGLGAPVGAVIAGDPEFHTKARIARKRFGGGMRQSGILAAAALYGLDHNYELLATDHENATRFAAIVEKAPGVVVTPPETNIVMMELSGSRNTTGASAGFSAAEIARRTAERGVKVVVITPTRLRAVTHLDASTEDVVAGAHVVAECIADAYERSAVVLASHGD